MSLSSLYVRDFAIVRKIELELEHGLTVVTGETGAGKSIMIDALDLVLGARGDSSTIRHGADSAEVLAGFELEAGGDAAGWLCAHELEDEGGCVLRRIVYRDKPTKAFINDRPVTVQTLRDLGDLRKLGIHTADQSAPYVLFDGRRLAQQLALF